MASRSQRKPAASDTASPHTADIVRKTVATGSIERREIKVGLSDGIQIEVISGLSATDKVKGQPVEAVPMGK